MNTTIFKIIGFKYMDKDKLHNEIYQYPFIKKIGESKIDGCNIYKITVMDICTERYYKINKLKGNQYLNYENIATENDARKFIQKYHSYMQLVSKLEDHLSSFV